MMGPVTIRYFLLYSKASVNRSDRNVLISKLKCYYAVIIIIITIIVIIIIIIVIKIILIMPDLTNFKRPFITLLVIYRNKRL